MSQIFTLTGEFGAGKTVTALSFTPPGWDGKRPVRRIVIDMEMRTEIYASPDGKDHPEKLQFAFLTLNKGTRATGAHFFDLMNSCRLNQWPDNTKPDVIVIDDTAMLQDVMFGWWNNVDNARKTAALFGKENHRAMRYFKVGDPGTISFFKELFTEWMLDLKQTGIALVITSPMHNRWLNYGSTARDAAGKPLMRIAGRTAKVLDCWTQMTDVVWNLSRKDGDKATKLPKVSMDSHLLKAALPGVPEQFAWPADGWAEIWKWHAERKFVADVTKLPQEEPIFDQQTIEDDIKAGKNLLIRQLGEAGLTKDEAVKLILEEGMPPYTLAGHGECLIFLLKVMAEREPARKDELIALARKFVPAK